MYWQMMLCDDMGQVIGEITGKMLGPEDCKLCHYTSNVICYGSAKTTMKWVVKKKPIWKTASSQEAALSIDQRFSYAMPVGYVCFNVCTANISKFYSHQAQEA